MFRNLPRSKEEDEVGERSLFFFFSLDRIFEISFSFTSGESSVSE
jgi:hypothetical protein